MGNRGCLHRDERIVRNHAGRRWIVCDLEFKGRWMPQWVEGRYTVLFFHDEAVALAAGHRPCAECRRERYEAWRSAWEVAFGVRPSADELDRVLHAARVDGDGGQRTHRAEWTSLPAGTFVQREQPTLGLEDRLLPWSSAGYGSAVDRPGAGSVVVLTPEPSVAVLRAGYEPVLAIG